MGRQVAFGPLCQTSSTWATSSVLLLSPCLAWTADDTQKSITGGAELAPAIEDVNSAIGTATQITDDIRSEYVKRLNAQASTMVAEDGDPAAQIDHAVAQVLKPY